MTFISETKTGFFTLELYECKGYRISIYKWKDNSYKPNVHFTPVENGKFQPRIIYTGSECLLDIANPCMTSIDDAEELLQCIENARDVCRIVTEFLQKEKEL